MSKQRDSAEGVAPNDESTDNHHENLQLHAEHSRDVQLIVASEFV